MSMKRMSRYFLFKRVKIKRSILSFSGIIVIATMYLFLSSLFDIDLGTNIIVSVILVNTPLDDANNVATKSDNVALEGDVDLIKNEDKNEFKAESLDLDLNSSALDLCSKDIKVSYEC